MEVVFGMKIVVLMIVEVMEVDEMMDTMVEEGLKCDMEKSMEVVLDGDLVEVDKEVNSKVDREVDEILEVVGMMMEVVVELGMKVVLKKVVDKETDEQVD